MKKTFALNTGAQIPAIGLGTWKLQGQIARQTVQEALTIGYRHIDTADHYGNHADIAAAIQDTAVPREDIFITTKLWMSDFHREDVYKACERALRELNTDYLDLYLMHWPDRSIPFEETLGAMRDLQDRGMIRAIGVSNFTIHHLEDALKTGVKISVNQVEFHPSFYQKELKAFCDKHEILVTAYSPIAQGTELTLPLIDELAKKYNKSDAEIILNWIVGKGIAAIPKATELQYLKDNLASLEWEMDPADSKKIDELNLNNRVFNPPFADFEY